MTKSEIVAKDNSFIMYTTEDGQTKIDVKYDNETV